MDAYEGNNVIPPPNGRRGGYILVAWCDSDGMAWRGPICMKFCGIAKRNGNMGWRLAYL
jgi:hypothetical protein